MSDVSPLHDRAAAFALAAGTVASLVTMGLHPTGAEAIRNAEAGGANVAARGVHLLAIAAQPLLLAGTAALTWRLRSRSAAFVGMASFTLAVFAVTVAAACSGLVAPRLAAYLAGTEGEAREALLRQFRYTGTLNQAFATLYVFLGGGALLAWGWAMRGVAAFGRGLGGLGMALGAAGIVIGATELVPLHIHGFGAVVVAQAVWMLWTARRLARPYHEA